MKKILAIILSLVMVFGMAFSLSGCSGSSGSGNAPATTPAAAAPAAAAPAKAPVTYKGNVDFITPNKAGGNTDLTTRLLADYISKNSDVNLTVLNNTDGNGVVAMETVRNADPDGHTLLLNHESSLIAMAAGINTYCKLEDFMNQYTPICVYASKDPVLYMMIVASNSPFNSVDDLVANAKANPGKLLFGSRTGTATDLMGARFTKDADIEWKQVDSGSDTDKLTQLVGGNVDVSIINVAQVAQYFEAGKVKVLAAYSLTAEGGRSSVKSLADVKSLVEMGYKNSYLNHMNFVIGPKDMDPDLVAVMHKLFYDAGQDQDVAAALTKMGNLVYPLDFEDGKKQLADFCTTIAEAAKILK